MWRERALKVVLVLVGLAFSAAPLCRLALTIVMRDDCARTKSTRYAYRLT
jgi:hypothetical protein